MDVRKPAVYRLDPETRKVESWEMPEKVGSLAVRSETSLLIAMQRRLAIFDLVTGTFEDLYLLPKEMAQHRFNDGKTDPAGRFVAGTLKDKSRVVDGIVQGGPPDEPEGTLYQIDGSHQVRALFDGITIPNGLAWSPDGRTMYFADTHIDAIYAIDYDPATGDLGERREFARTDDHPGQPDGATVDAEGFLWSAEYRGWRIVRYGTGRPHRPDRQPAGPAADTVRLRRAQSRHPFRHHGKPAHSRERVWPGSLLPAAFSPLMSA